MSPSPYPQSSPRGDPFTFTSDVDSSYYASMMATLSDNPDGPSFQTVDPHQSSKLAELTSKFGPNATPSTLTTSSIATTNTPSQSTNAAPVSSADPSSQNTGASSASVSATGATHGTASAASSTNSSGSTASSAANTSTGADLSQKSSSMSSPGMQAAVAVPVVIAVLGAVALLFFFMRRRKKRRVQAGDEMEKVPAQAGRKRKWTHHLRVFSFDTELLMGGRYSSTNSIRSRETGSLRSANRSQHTQSPSVHSVDEVAPPYRDAITAAQPPTISSVMAAGAAGMVAGGVHRSISSATAGTAPPPYAGSRPQSPTTPPTAHLAGQQNPFADSPPISPVEGSPFNDPPETTPPVSRNSSLYRSDRGDASTTGGASEAASICEATLARNASVVLGGRVIDNVTRSSR